MSKTVIIGGVAAGASCAARLRRLDKDADIVLLERGDYISYANCGLPYHIGNVIPEQDDLLLMTPELMNNRFDIDVRIRNEVTKIDRDNQTITILDHNKNESYEESYDTLVIATGSSPLRPPIPGIESEKIQTLWTVHDATRLKAQAQTMKTALIVGGGFIGLEMAENLKEAGVDVTLVEAMDQVMAPLDYEMAQLVHQELKNKGIHLILNDGVDSFEDNEQGVKTTLKSGTQIQSDSIILSIGVRPNSQLAKDAGLDINQRGGIKVNDSLQTTDPNIYAMGDVIEVNDFIFGGKTMIPLAGPANKQGRIVANNIVGNKEIYKGTQGSSVAKIFDLTVAATGANEKTLKRLEKEYESIIIRQNSHAGYYPGAQPMMIKLLFSKDGSQIYGAQIVGNEGVDKRIDVLATAIRLHASIEDLKELELAYAPPYSSAKDPINMAGFVAGNVLDGLAQIATWDEVETHPEAQVLDVREGGELKWYSLPMNFTHIPLGQLRERVNELDKEKEVIVFCAIGVRAYNAARILSQNGYKNVKIYPGGVNFYKAVHLGE